MKRGQPRGQITVENIQYREQNTVKTAEERVEHYKKYTIEVRILSCYESKLGLF